VLLLLLLLLLFVVFGPARIGVLDIESSQLIIEMHTQQQQQQQLQLHSGQSYRVFTTDCEQYAISSSLRYEGLRVWNLQSGELVRIVGGPNDAGYGFTVCGDYVITATTFQNNEYPLKVFNWKTNECVKVLRDTQPSSAHKNHILAVCMNPFADWIVSGDFDGIVKVWKS